MIKNAILIITVIATIMSCKNSSKNSEDVNKVTSQQEQPNVPTILNGEPILKYGHKFSKDCSANSLDWDGAYLGATSNKDGNYCRLRLTLNKDWTYQLKIMAIEFLNDGDVKETLQNEVSGSFTFDNAGEIIKLIGSNHPVTNELISVKLGENYLSVLDGDLKELNKDGDMNTLYK